MRPTNYFWAWIKFQPGSQLQSSFKLIFSGDLPDVVPERLIERVTGHGQKAIAATLENGRLALFRNFDEHGNPIPRPNTILIDSAEVCRKHGISEASFYKWKSKYGGMEVSEAKRLKALEDENAKLKKLLADAMLDNAALKDLLSKKW